MSAFTPIALPTDCRLVPRAYEKPSCVHSFIAMAPRSRTSFLVRCRLCVVGSSLSQAISLYFAAPCCLLLVALIDSWYATRVRIVNHCDSEG